MSWNKTIFGQVSIGVAASLIGSFLAGGFFTYLGAYASGVAEGARQERNRQDSEWIKEKQDKEMAFTKGLEKREAAMVAKFDATVEARCKEDILNAQKRGHETGFSSGRLEGEKFGHQACRADCRQMLDFYMDFGQYWTTFEDTVKAIDEIDPKNEDMLKELAESIVALSVRGRKALSSMAAQLNSEVDIAARALENNDIETLKRALRVLSSTLKARRQEWNIHYKTLVGFKNL